MNDINIYNTKENLLQAMEYTRELCEKIDSAYCTLNEKLSDVGFDDITKREIAEMMETIGRLASRVKVFYNDMQSGVYQRVMAMDKYENIGR